MIKTFVRTYRRVFKLLDKKILKKFWLIQLLIIVTSIIDLFGLAAFIPVLSAVANPKLIVDNTFFVQIKLFSGITDEINFILFLFISAFVFFFFRMLFIIMSQWIQSKFVFSLSEHIGEKTYNYYMKMDYQLFYRKDSSNIIRELTQSPAYFARFLVMPLLLIISETTIVVFIITAIALYDIKVFFMLVLTIFPIAFVFQSVVKKRLRKYGVEHNALVPKHFALSNRAINGFVDAKLRGKESMLATDHLNVFKKINKINVVTSTLNIVPAKLFELATVLGLLLIFVYGSFWVKSTGVVISLIAMYSAAGYRIIPSLSKVVPAFMQLEQYSYLFDIFDLPLKEKKMELYSFNELKPLSFNEKIHIDNVSFKYKNEKEKFISNVDFSIKKGEIIGVIGKSGSGKTTLVKIISGFLNPVEGQVLVDNIKLTEENVRSWMFNISYVQQSPYLEKGTLSSNIAFLENEINREKLKKAIEMASLSEFVMGRNPDEIFVDELGKNLSGGQKQRIVIARALYNDSKLIIFDEATSSLDNATEKEVNDAIKKLKGTGVTIIIVAHRYTTLAHTDRIIELDKDGALRELLYTDIINS